MFLLVVTVWLILLAGLSSSGNWLDTTFYLVTAVACIATIGIMAQPVQMYRRRELDDPDIAIRDGGLWIEQRGRDLVVQLILIASSASAGLIFAIGQWTGTLGVPVSRGFAIAAPLLAVLVAVYGSIQLVLLLAREFAMSTVVLSPDRVRVIYGISDRTLPWAEISHLSINTPAIGRRHAIDCLVHLRVSEGRSLDINTNWLSTGCAPTYWLLKFYFEHPEHRDELGDQRAVDRLMSGRVVTRR
ncbi:hypothetical protein [Williamsia maris]|uniref:PH (Pleckstrin Homology) domain-containing protein n=1 Tax=Williamsia maris TaxID=72806 RepID=A0ABT1H990_9NOCA|nr:hypothetical protein [Williamsia maris]MCP2174744.1 hypothetical protein [Williamsia maris]